MTRWTNSGNNRRLNGVALKCEEIENDVANFVPLEQQMLHVFGMAVLMCIAATLWWFVLIASCLLLAACLPLAYSCICVYSECWLLNPC